MSLIKKQSRNMKQLVKYAMLVAVLLLAGAGAQARTITVNAGQVRGDLTEELRRAAQQATNRDTVVFNFGRGTYTVSGTIPCVSHVVIKGAGRDQSTIILDKGVNRPGFRAFTDDTFFRIHGTLAAPVSLSVSDITFRLKEHSGIWWNDSEVYAVKVHHANRVDICRVNSYMRDAKITNFDLHVCSNVTVSDCILSNLNNCDTGGNLWIRGEMHNISVKNNKFYKYGKDEALAVFDRLVDNSDKYTRGRATRTDIYIEGNEFYYGGYEGKDKDLTAFNQMIVSLFTDHRKTTDRCVTRNYHLTGNTFYINDKCTRSIYVSFDPADEHEDIYIENNRIVNSALASDEKYYRQDIEVNDLSSSRDTIHINGNTVTNRNLVLNKYGTEGYCFLLMQGGNVIMDGNRITNEVTTVPATGKLTGVQLVWAGAEGGTVTMRNNVCRGIKCVAYVGAGDGTKLFNLTATNNYFAGDTRVYSHKVEQMNLNFTGNTFKSENMNFFLVEFAPRGTVVFNNNDVTVADGKGQFMTHWSKASTSTMRFDRLEVRNNVFRGVRSEQELFKHVTRVNKRKINANRISQ